MSAIVEEEKKCPECKPGLPAWMATFSDLMALLMCFFVLLLSFSELDAMRFKRLAGSMRNAFGVQNQLNFDAIPKGTSIIAQEFSPGRPDPTPLNVITQDTVRDLMDSLEVLCQDEMTIQETRQGDTGQLTRQIVVPDDVLQEQVEQEAASIASRLGEFIDVGALEVETVDQTIIIRVKEQSFGPGSDFVADEFLPILDRVRAILLTTPGELHIAGHTDSIPLNNNARFRNNWLLSSSRALAVAEYLWADPEMDENRFVIVGHGASRPIADNGTAEGRSTNRRVEIMIRRDNPEFAGPVVPESEQGDEVDFGPPDLFGLNPDEIF